MTIEIIEQEAGDFNGFHEHCLSIEFRKMDRKLLSNLPEYSIPAGWKIIAT
jgi:hypothetical protein